MLAGAEVAMFVLGVQSVAFPAKKDNSKTSRLMNPRVSS